QSFVSDFDGLTPVRHTVGDTCRPPAVWSCVMLTEATVGGVRPTGFRWGQTPNLPSGILSRLPRTANNTAAEAMCEKCPPATWKRLSCPFPVLNRAGDAIEPKKSRRKVDANKASHPALLEREDCTLVAWYRYLYAPRTGGRQRRNA